MTAPWPMILDAANRVQSINTLHGILSSADKEALLIDVQKSLEHLDIADSLSARKVCYNAVHGDKVASFWLSDPDAGAIPDEMTKLLNWISPTGALASLANYEVKRFYTALQTWLDGRPEAGVAAVFDICYGPSLVLISTTEPVSDNERGRVSKVG